MKHITVSGLDHQLAPYFILQQLRQGQARIDCIGDPDSGAERQLAPVHAVLAAEDAPAALRDHLRWQAAPGEADLHYRFMSAAALRQLFEREGSHRPFHAVDGAAPTIVLIVDRHHLPQGRTIESCLRAIEQAVHASAAGGRVVIYCLGACIDDVPLLRRANPVGTAPLASLVTHTADFVGEIRRRSPAYFDHYALRTRHQCQQQFRVMSASAAARQVAMAIDKTPAAHSLVLGSHALSIAQVLASVAQLAGAGMMTGDREPAPAGAPSALFDKWIAQTAAHAQQEAADIDEAREGGFILQQVASAAVDPLQLIQDALRRAASEGELLRRSFASLPGLRSATLGNVRYHSYGDGAETFLLVNAFGLPLDFWAMLTEALGSDFRVLVIDKPTAAPEAVSDTYYAVPDYVPDYLAAVDAVLAHESVAACHVVSWCGGAKLALELARAFPRTIASLSLVTPSFAGMTGYAGADSAYEKNLFTMCALVDKNPKSAATMASTLLAIMKKGDNDMARFDIGHKNYTNVLELAEHHHLPLIYRPFSSADNLVSFSAQLVRFRRHDVGPLLSCPELALPVMLMTGRADTTTSSIRATDLCAKLPNVVGFDIEGGSHYVLHQNYRLVARLLKAFAREGIALSPHHPHLTRSLYRNAGAPTAHGRALPASPAPAALPA